MNRIQIAVVNVTRQSVLRPAGRFVSAAKRAVCTLAAVAICCAAVSSASATPLPQTNMLTWFRADAGVTTSGTEVTTWADQASVVGGANNALRITAGQAPQLVASALGGKPTLRFDGANDYLRIGPNSSFNSDQFTWFIVGQADSTSPATPGLMLRSNYASGAGGSGGSERLWGTYNGSGVFTSHSRQLSNTFVGSDNTNSVSPTLISATWAVDNSVTQWRNGTIGTINPLAATAAPASHQFTFIGSDSFTLSNFYDGDISEIIIYNTAQLQADRRLVENYLAAKYSGTVGSNALPLSNELYAGDDVAKGNYDLDVFGIGRESDGTVSTRSDDLGLTLTDNTGSGNGLAVGEYALAGHKLATNAVVSTDVAAGSTRWDRSWYVDTTGSFDATMSFDFSDAGITLDTSMTTLLYRGADSGTFAPVSTSGTFVGDKVSFNLSLSSLQNGYYTLGFVPPVPEPTTLSLLGLFSLGLVRISRRRNMRNK